jgi:hypothetical protein
MKQDTKTERLRRLHDAKLIVDATLRHSPETDRGQFVQRLRRSYRMHGSLTPAMREALCRGITMASS